MAACIVYGQWRMEQYRHSLVDASGNGNIHNLTNSGYSDGNARWVLDGKAMLFSSDRAGYRSHGSWGAEYDAYIMFFDLDAMEKFQMTKEERQLAKENMTKKEKKEEEKKERMKRRTRTIRSLQKWNL